MMMPGHNWAGGKMIEEKRRYERMYDKIRDLTDKVKYAL